ncbi:uncharacterized protein LOC142784617 [Rhipicephalus microplus]|uniref:uncharacterized protein LOC142784617 n=1 Tax=Rhipicephalus microplus TaxID=6941 RepID=UPI003F6C4944
MEHLRNTRAARWRYSTKIINAVDELLASDEFNLVGLRSILQRLEKCTDELAKAIEALHAHMTEDEVLRDMESMLEYEDRTAESVGLLKHRTQELAVRTLWPARSNSVLPSDPSLPRQAAPSDISAGTGARLPNLDLTRFDVSPTKWLPFWDLFRHSVHENPRLNNVDWFHYLRSLLDGLAEKAILGILTSDNSYEGAVSIKVWFGDVRMIEQRHLKNLHTLRPVTTSVNVSALRSLYTTSFKST